MYKMDSMDAVDKLTADFESVDIILFVKHESPPYGDSKDQKENLFL